MAALWVSPDNVDCGTGAAKFTVCIRITGVGSRSGMPHIGRNHHVLLVQPHLARAGAQCTTRPPATSFQGHG
jgi:hypothetical protein